MNIIVNPEAATTTIELTGEETDTLQKAECLLAYINDRVAHASTLRVVLKRTDQEHLTLRSTLGDLVKAG